MKAREKLLESAQQKSTEFQSHPLIAPVLRRLERELPDSLCYHNHAHTLSVLDDVILFALHDKRETRELELLSIGAAFHDAGFLKNRVDNEPIGALMAARVMEESGEYTPSEVQLVKEMIEDTKLFFVPSGAVRTVSSELSKYLLDADLSNLGREDFFEKNDCLLMETGLDPKLFHQHSLKLLKQHRWLTEAGTAFREAQRKRNLQIFERIVAAEG